MNSEKVKEIKECLEEFKNDRIGYYTNGIDRFMLTKEDTLALINELENENERLMKLQARGGCRVAELGIENQQLKDRIAELENTDYYKEIERKKEDLLCKEYGLIKYEKETAGKYLKQFAERLKEKLGSVDLIRGWAVKVFIDETLKEYE